MSHNFNHSNGIHQLNEPLQKQLKTDQANLNPQKFQIQVATKKKKQVINLDSSSEKQKSDQAEDALPAETIAPKEQKKAKVKKIQHKCQLCKGSGKKVQMKKCTQCKFYTHIHCLDENQVKGKFICDKCRAMNNVQENKTVKKQKKLEEKNQILKITQKKMQKQKKKDESNRVLQRFKEKYPFYIGDGQKIKFPIQDKLLFIYRQYFESSQSRVSPTDHPLIPGKYLGDFLEIENFIASFGNEILQDYQGDYRKSVLFVLMNCKGTDKTFQRLLGAIIKIYLKDIFQKNKTENVKILNDNCFFILLGTINEAQQMSADYVAMTAPQIIRQLSTVPSMKNSFKDFNFPDNLNLQSKVKILITLIQGLSQVDGFHDMVSRKSQKISEMTKDKADFVNKLKKNEAQALSNKQKLKQMLGRVNKYNENQNQLPEQERQNNKNIVKQMQKTKKKTQKLANQGQVSQRIIKDFKSKIVSITKKIPFVISQILFLGSDRNDSHYFFYLRQPHRIYVRYRNYLLDQNEEFKIYQTKQKITQLLKTFNTKGSHEKRLYQSIHNLVKQQVIRNLTMSDDFRDNASNMEQEVQKCVFLEGDNQFRQKIISDVMQIQEKFSTYLAIKHYRWSNDSKRQQFRFGFPYIQDLQAMKQQIKNLQQSFLFVQVIKQKQVMRQQSDSNEQIQKENNYSNQKELCRRKKPIRIWGINSQRVKKFWIQYLQTCINHIGVWISVNIFKNYVDKYIQKKMQHIREQQKKENDLKQRQQKKQRIRQRQQKQNEKLRMRENKERQIRETRQRPKYILKKNREVTSLSPMQQESEQGVRAGRTDRILRPSTRSKNRPLTIDSDDQQQEQQQAIDQESDNDDECDICKDTGQVICCDTCPKVFHLTCLGLKQTPQGQWSCMDCLYKLNNQRQTRSRSRKLGK